MGSYAQPVFKSLVFIRPDQIEIIQADAERAYPQECCGLLLGRSQQNSKTLVEVYPTANAWRADVAVELDGNQLDLSKTRRYSIDPKEMLKGQRYTRDAGLEIIGIYHSHPDHPAVPSECDRRNAWSEYLYLIVSVDRGIAQDLLCWRLNEQHQFQPHVLNVMS